MLLCDIEEIQEGARLAAAVISDQSPDVELLKPGVRLDSRILTRLQRLGVRQVWIDHDIARDLDQAVAPQISRTKLDLYRRLKDNISAMSKASVTAAHVHQYRQVLMDLVCEIAGSGRYSVMTDRLFACRGDLFTHSTNVAHLSILIGLQIEAYIIRERPRLTADHARDLVTLGLGAMLHDIGKVGAELSVIESHEIHRSSDGMSDDARRAYDQHPICGYTMLRNTRMAASACQVVLNHHQRYDGTGWPDQGDVFGPKHCGTQEGREIHIFSRIVAAANVLDNLLQDAEGERRPPVAALHDFSTEAYEGWFDPTVRKAALRCIPPFPIGAMVQISDGRKAAVAKPNLHHPCRPVVRLMESPAGADSEDEARIVDLAEHKSLRIARCAGVDVEQWYFELPDTTRDAQAAA